MQAALMPDVTFPAVSLSNILLFQSRNEDDKYLTNTLQVFLLILHSQPNWEILKTSSDLVPMGPDFRVCTYTNSMEHTGVIAMLRIQEQC